MVLRMPHAAAAAPPAAPSSSRYGSAREMEVLIDALHAQLELKERQRQAAVDAYARRVRVLCVLGRAGAWDVCVPLCTALPAPAAALRCSLTQLTPAIIQTLRSSCRRASART